MGGFTPGPWGVRNSSRRINVTYQGAGKGWVIATMAITAESTLAHLGYANAHLIAVAPEMADLLADCLATFEDQGRGNGALAKRIRAVLAKATP